MAPGASAILRTIGAGSAMFGGGKAYAKAPRAKAESVTREMSTMGFSDENLNVAETGMGNRGGFQDAGDNWGKDDITQWALFAGRDGNSRQYKG